MLKCSLQFGKNKSLISGLHRHKLQDSKADALSSTLNMKHSRLSVNRLQHLQVSRTREVQKVEPKQQGLIVTARAADKFKFDNASTWVDRIMILCWRSLFEGAR